MEVLREAVTLIAERGYAGASLRELARRLGVQQPSLYHYFDTKEQLIEQIIRHLGVELLTSVPSVDVPAKLEDLPGYAIEMVMGLWEGTRYPNFVRFLFAVAVEQPQYRAAIQALYGHGAAVLSDAILAPYVERGELTRDEGRALIRGAINSVALLQIEERLLYGRKSASAELRTHAIETERWLRDALKYRAKKRR